jgi:uncharacterized protein YjbJ (UPF0337 family)
MKDSPMTQQVKGNWKQFKGKVQEAWGDLTNDDLDRYEGQREQLEGHIQEKTGETRSDIRDRIDEIARDTKYNV